VIKLSARTGRKWPEANFKLLSWLSSGRTNDDDDPQQNVRCLVRDSTAYLLDTRQPSDTAQPSCSMP